MMRSLLVLLAVLTTACVPRSVPPTETPVLPQPDAKVVTPVEVKANDLTPIADLTGNNVRSVVASPEVKPAPQITPRHALKYSEVVSNGVTFSIVSFDTRDHYLAITDQEPGARWVSAKSAAVAQKAIASINGGFFQVDGSPLGAVRQKKYKAGSWNTQSSLTSGVYQKTGSSMRLLRNKFANRSAETLLQTGPFLVENNKAVSGLSNKKTTNRSLLLSDGKNHFAFAMTSVCTLSSLSKAVLELPSHLPKKNALNLDGGRSCDLYVSEEINGGPVVKSHWLKNPVRNYLLLQAY